MSKAKSGKSEIKNYHFCHKMAFVMYCQKLRVAKVRCQILEWHKQSWQKLEWQKQSFPHFIPINGPLFRWAVSSPCYLSAFSKPIYSWAHFQHSITYGPLLPFSACGPNSARGYSRPVCGPLIHWAVFRAS